MKHEAIQDLLSSYLDGELGPDERAAVEAHIGRCSSCREELDLLRLTLDALRDMPQLEAPSGFAEAVMGQVEAEAPAGSGEGAEVVSLDRWRVPIWAPVALAAAACLVVGLFWWMGPERFRPTGHDAEPFAMAPAAEKAAGPDALAEAEPAMVAQLESTVSADEPARSDDLDGVAEVDELASLEGELRGVAPQPDRAQQLPGAPSIGGTATGESFVPWEETEEDALADGGGEVASRTREHADEAEPAPEDVGVARHELERLEREEEGYRDLYGGDAVADSIVVADEAEAWSATELQPATTASPTAGLTDARVAKRSADLGDAEDDHDYDRYDDADLGAANGEYLGSNAIADLSIEEVEEGATYYTERKSRAPRLSSRDRSRKASERAGGSRRAQGAPDAEPLPTLSEAPAEEPAEQQQAAVASRSATAEWTLQTTDPGVLYKLSDVCGGSSGLACSWTSPNSSPVSLDPQQNYQVVGVTLAAAAYESFHSSLRGLGNLLVRSEDVALAGPADSVTITIVVEYLP